MCQARGDEEGSGLGRLPGQGRGKGAIKLDIEGGRGGRRKRPLKTRERKEGEERHISHHNRRKGKAGKQSKRTKNGKGTVPNRSSSED